ncbi:MAG: hypothetical protein JW786_06465, partial [Desulfobacterales bacterium]|nr:hypothetical protein [Desulfobacterales bacterium]
MSVKNPLFKKIHRWKYTSPLIFLEKIDSLNLLKKCFRKIYIPESVKNEWGIKSIPSFISVHSLSEFGKSHVKGAIGRLHKGELEAIQLAIEFNCKFIWVRLFCDMPYNSF